MPILLGLLFLASIIGAIVLVVVGTISVLVAILVVVPLLLLAFAILKTKAVSLSGLDAPEPIVLRVLSVTATKGGVRIEIQGEDETRTIDTSTTDLEGNQELQATKKGKLWIYKTTAESFKVGPGYVEHSVSKSNSRSIIRRGTFTSRLQV